MARKSRKNLSQPEQAAASVLLPELEEAKIPAAIYTGYCKSTAHKLNLREDWVVHVGTSKSML